MRFAMADSPSQATFLSPVERTWLQQRNADLKASPAWLHVVKIRCLIAAAASVTRLFFGQTKRPQTQLLG